MHQSGDSIASREPLLAELLCLLKQLSRIALTARTDRLRPEDFAVLANQNGGPVGYAGILEPQTVFPGNGALRVKVGQQRKGDSLEAFSPSNVAKFRIYTETQNLGLGRVELLQKSVQTRDFYASSGREIKRVRNKQDILRAPEFRQRYRRVLVALEFEIRSLRPGRDECH